MDDRFAVGEVDGGEDSLTQFLQGGDANVAERGAGELGKESFDKVEPGAVLGREYEGEAAFGLLGEPSPGFLGNVSGMIVEDDLDGGRGRVGGVEPLEELDELARAMSFLDAGVDDAGQEIDAGQQAERSQSHVFVIAGHGGMAHGLGRQIGRRGRQRLYTGLLVVGNDRHRGRLRVWPLAVLRLGRLFQQRDLAVDAQDFGHLLSEFGVAALQIVAHLVRLDLGRGQYLAQGSLGEIGQAGMPGRRTLFAHVARQQPRRPQFMRIAQILGFATGQIDDERPRLAGDDRLAPRTRTVVESRHDPELLRAPQTSLDRLMRHADGASGCIQRRRLAIGQKNARPLDTARRFRSRARNPFEIDQLLFRKRQLDHTPRRGHFPFS